MSNSSTSVVAEIAFCILLLFQGVATAAEPEVGEAAAGLPDAAASRSEPAAPSDDLLRQLRLERANAEVERELARISTEVRIEEARRALREVRDIAIPDLVATFQVNGVRFAEFGAGGARFDRRQGQWLTQDWRIDEVHDDHVVLCARRGERCRVVTMLQQHAPDRGR